MMYMLIVTVCAYIGCFGAAESSTGSCSTNSIQGWARLPKPLVKTKQSKHKNASKRMREYVRFAKSQKSSSLVKSVAKKWIQILPSTDERPCQLNFTSIGKKQLLACFVAGEYPDQAKTTTSFLYWMRTHWFSELSNLHYAVQRGKADKKALAHHPFNMDILGHSVTAVMNYAGIDVVSAIHDNKLSLAFFVASKKGVHTYYCKPGKKIEGIMDGDWDQLTRYANYARQLFVGSPYQPENLIDLNLPVKIDEPAIKSYFGSSKPTALKRQRIQ